MKDFKEFFEKAKSVETTVSILQEQLKEEYLGEMASATPAGAFYLWLNAPEMVQKHDDWIIEESDLTIKIGLRDHAERYSKVDVTDYVWDWLTSVVMTDDAVEMYQEGSIKTKIAILEGIVLEDEAFEEEILEIVDFPHTFTMDW